MKQIARTVSLFSVFAMATACGSSAPTIDTVKENFENPTGSTNDRNAVIAANQKTTASGPATRLAGTGAGFGLGLTAVGKPVGIERLQVRRMFSNELRQLHGFVNGQGHQALLGELDGTGDNCGDDEAVQDAVKKLSLKLLTGGSGKASFSYGADLAQCTGGELTGKMDVDGEIELSESKFRFLVKQGMNNVCEQGGDQACVTGEFVVEVAVQGGLSGLGSTSASSAQVLSSWFLNATWTEDGAAREAELKGGLQVSTSDDGSVSLEYLAFVMDDAGNEVSYVLSFNVAADGSGTFECRGADGSITCTLQADGSGACTATDSAGTAEFSWTASEADAVSATEEFIKY